MTEQSFMERASRALRLLDAESGADPETWHERMPSVDLVLRAVAESLAAGKPVRIPGVGVLRTKLRRRRIIAPGPNRGKAIEERVAILHGGAVVSAGEPYEV